MDEIIQKDLQVPGGILMKEEALLLALSVFISKRHFFFLLSCFHLSFKAKMTTRPIFTDSKCVSVTSI